MREETASGDWPWWLGNTLKSGAADVAKANVEGKNRCGLPPTSPELISAQNSELVLPMLMNRTHIITGPCLQPHVQAQKLSQSLTRLHKGAIVPVRRKVQVICSEDNTEWVQALRPGYRGEVRAAWVNNFQVSDSKVRWKGLTSSQAQGWSPHPGEKGNLLVTPETGLYKTSPIDRPHGKPKAKEAQLEREVYRDVRGRAHLLNELAEAAREKRQAKRSELHKQQFG
ncbi:hypothetical protein CYMTET_47455 [Cymbomonas tetramitiformis]|uniref:Uncharacterized protein n=1 Tax=Cymbomonas tetramitiformis TaxID=36881 RepID=A0AAE0BW02_9CHLO|nr:hypothetical protein CYMTET_47455 [Cymbomonas tetramitiformis]